MRDHSLIQTLNLGGASQDLTQIFETYLAGQVTEGTRRIYRRDLLDIFGEQIPTLSQVQTLRPEDLKLWRNQAWKQGEGLAASTINRKLTVLACFYNHLAAYGFVSINPANSRLVRRIKEKRQVGAKIGITKEEMEVLLLACNSTTKTPADVRDFTLISLLYTCLLRRGETEKILWKDIKMEGGRSILHLPTSKNGTNDFVPIEKELLRWLDRYYHAMGGAETWIGSHAKPIQECPVFLALDRAHFGEGLSANGINEIVKKRARLAQIQDVTAHLLRHTGITHLLIEGHSLADVQVLARHSSANQTAAYALLLRRLDNSPGKSLAALVGGVRNNI